MQDYLFLKKKYLNKFYRINIFWFDLLPPVDLDSCRTDYDAIIELYHLYMVERNLEETIEICYHVLLQRDLTGS